MRELWVRPIDRDVLERTARIVGGASAAAAALADAASHDGQVCFYKTRDDSIVVIKRPGDVGASRGMKDHSA